MPNKESCSRLLTTRVAEERMVSREELLEFLKERSKQDDYLEPKVSFYKKCSDGTAVEYHKNGKKKREDSYYKGEKYGICTEWSDRGVVISKKVYLGGVAVKDLLAKEKKTGEVLTPSFNRELK